jgi:hypothetical protein
LIILARKSLQSTGGDVLVKTRYVLAISVLMLLLFWATRLAYIEAFPPFIDEALHVDYAKDVVERGPFDHGQDGRQLMIWWLVLFQPYRNEAILVGRMAVLISALAGLAALLAIGRLFAGLWGLVFAGILYLLSTYHLFFDRLVLADPVSGAAASIALYFACRLRLRVDWRDAAAAGIMIFIAIGAKVLALPYLAIPVAAALVIRPPVSRQMRQWAVIGTGISLGLLLIFVLVLNWRGEDPFYFLASNTPGQASETPFLSRIFTNFQDTLAALVIYFGVVGAPGLLSALVYLLIRRQWFLPIFTLVPMGVYWLNAQPNSRHFVAPISLLLVCGGIALADFLRHYSLRYKMSAAAGLIAIMLLYWLPFAITAAENPTSLALPSGDEAQYLTSDASGSGIPETMRFLTQEHPRQVFGLLSNCLGLRYLSLTSFPVSCPRINPNGSDVEALAALMAENRAEGVYVVLENSAYVPSEAPGKLLITITRPQNGPSLAIYDLAPH